MKFVSSKRAIISGILSILLVFYFFNFIPRNINILSTRSLGVQIFDYILNFLIFFVIIYLLSAGIVFIYKRMRGKT